MDVFCAHDKLEPVDKLIPNPRNPNKHPDRQIELLAKIINYNGWRYPIVVSNRSGFITKGHGRLLAAIKNKWATVPVDYQDYDSEAKEYADMVADNKIQELSDPDMKMVEEDARRMKDEIGDFEYLGMADFKLPEQEEEENARADEIPTDVESVCKPGDLWQLGEHRLLCGDCTDASLVDRLMDGEKADMVFTDPPYGVNAVNVGGGSNGPQGSIGGSKAVWDRRRSRETHKNKIIKANLYKPVVGDDTTDTAIRGIKALEGKVKIFWGAQCYAEHLPPSQGWIVWDKDTTGTLGDGELAWTNQNRAIRIFKHTWNGLIKESERNEKRCHPTQKPVALAAWCFENYGEPKTVLDGFLGSGSTLIACEKTKRKCYGMEIDPHYCDVIIQRWEEYTGKHASKT